MCVPADTRKRWLLTYSDKALRLLMAIEALSADDCTEFINQSELMAVARIKSRATMGKILEEVNSEIAIMPEREGARKASYSLLCLLEKRSSHEQSAVDQQPDETVHGVNNQPKRSPQERFEDETPVAQNVHQMNVSQERSPDEHYASGASGVQNVHGMNTLDPDPGGNVHQMNEHAESVHGMNVSGKNGASASALIYIDSESNQHTESLCSKSQDTNPLSNESENNNLIAETQTAGTRSIPQATAATAQPDWATIGIREIRRCFQHGEIALEDLRQILAVEKESPLRPPAVHTRKRDDGTPWQRSDLVKWLEGQLDPSEKVQPEDIELARIISRNSLNWHDSGGVFPVHSNLGQRAMGIVKTLIQEDPRPTPETLTAAYAWYYREKRKGQGLAMPKRDQAIADMYRDYLAWQRGTHGEAHPLESTDSEAYRQRFVSGKYADVIVS